MVKRAREDSQVYLAGEGKSRDGWAIPLPGKRNVVEVYNSTLAAAGAYEVSTPVDVWKTRQIHLFLEATSAAIANQVSIIPEVSNQDEDFETSWYPIAVTDSSVSERDLTAVPSGGNYTSNNFGGVVFRPLEIQTAAADAGSDVQRMVITLDVVSAKFIRFQVAEFGDTASPSDLVVKVAKSI